MEQERKANDKYVAQEDVKRKRYTTPQLFQYGNVREITKNLGPKGDLDGGGGAAAGPKTGQ